MKQSELSANKLAVVTEVARYLKSIRAPTELYQRLIACLDYDDEFWLVVVSPLHAWRMNMWVWFLYKQREQEDSYNVSVTGNESGGVNFRAGSRAQIFD